jgi:hypothetical protein
MSADLVRFPATIERRLGLSERYRGRYLMAAAGRRPAGLLGKNEPFSARQHDDTDGAHDVEATPGERRFQQARL